MLWPGFGLAALIGDQDGDVVRIDGGQVDQEQAAVVPAGGAAAFAASSLFTELAGVAAEFGADEPADFGDLVGGSGEDPR